VAGDTSAYWGTANVTVNLGGANYTGITVATVSGSNDKLTGGSAAATLTGSGTYDTLTAGSGGGVLTASNTGDTLVAGSGATTLSETGTSSFYDVTSTSGSATIANGTSSGSTASNELDFGSGLNDENLWFVHSGNDLVIDLMGTSKSVTVKNWFAHNYSQLQEITAGGLKLDSQVSQLVQAMATYSAAHAGFNPATATTIPTDTTLQNAIAAAWHS
jgi:Ca2+-binding RTX toxin-like protein